MESKSSKELREPSLGTNWKGVRFQKNCVEQDSRGVMGRQVFQETARSKLFTKWKEPIPPSNCKKQTLHRTQGMHTTAAHGDHEFDTKKNCSFCHSVCHALVKSCCAFVKLLENYFDCLHVFVYCHLWQTMLRSAAVGFVSLESQREI